MFNKFREAVFINKNEVRERKQKELYKFKILKSKLKDKDKIIDQIDNLEKGKKGEEEIIYQLQSTNIGMYILQDVRFEDPNNKDIHAEIDFMIFTGGSNYIVECKNLTGNVIIDENGEFIIDKETIESPITQSDRQKDIVKKIWLNNINKVLSYFFDKYFDKEIFKTIVVLANEKNHINKEKAPADIKDKIIRADQLASYIKKDMEKYKGELATEKQIKKCALKWQERSSEPSGFEKDYKKFLNQYIEEQLKEYRDKKAAELKYTKDYIFDDEELKELVDKTPTTIQELAVNDILKKEVKLKLYGQDIVNIIKNCKEI